MVSQNSVSLTPNAIGSNNISGRVTHVYVNQDGQTVKAGELLVQLDSTNAQQSVQNAVQSLQQAKIDLDSAKLSLKKMQQPATALQVLQAQDAVTQAKDALDQLQNPNNANAIQQAQTDLQNAQNAIQISSDGVTPQVVRNAYDQAVPTLQGIAPLLRNALLDADKVIGADNITANPNLKQFLSVLQPQYVLEAQSEYQIAKTSVQNLMPVVDALQTTNQDTASIDAAASSTLDSVNVVEKVLTTVEDELASTPASTNFSQASIDSLMGTAQADQSSVAGKITVIVNLQQGLQAAKNSSVTSLNAYKKSQLTLQNLQNPPDPRSVATAQEKVSEAQVSLQTLQAGALPIDVAIAQNTVDQRAAAVHNAQVALGQAENTLSNYQIRAPFDGVLAHMSVNVGDNIGPSTSIGTLVTTQDLANIPLNEIDASSIKVGQKVTGTFDALPGLSLVGTVQEIDPLGVVSQGVVNYTLFISFGTQDPRVKPGMSVNVSIIKQVDQDVLAVPNSAVKTIGGQAVVQVAQMSATTTQTSQGVSVSLPTPPTARVVQVGISDGKLTEITSGLQEGDMVVTQTITATTKTAAAPTTGSAASLLGGGGVRIPGLGGGGGGGGRGGGG